MPSANTRNYNEPLIAGCEDSDDGNHEYQFDRLCGAVVCNYCGDHKGLVRCFCSWSKSGRNGRAELIEWGEQIDDDY
jgi:hypothetical protein